MTYIVLYVRLGTTLALNFYVIYGPLRHIPLLCGWFCAKVGGLNLTQRTLYDIKLERQLGTQSDVKDNICRKGPDMS